MRSRDQAFYPRGHSSSEAPAEARLASQGAAASSRRGWLEAIAPRWPVLALVILLSGCVPEERFWWSPAGDQALVAVDGKLHLVGSDGALREPLPPFTEPGSSIKYVSWLPDGNSFLAVRQRRVSTWEQVRDWAPAEEVAAVDQLMPVVLPLLALGKEDPKHADTVQGLIESLPAARKKHLHFALLRHYQSHPDQTRAALETIPRGKDWMKALEKEGEGFELEEMRVFPDSGGGANPPLPLAHTLVTSLLLPKVSPKHPCVAVIKLDEKDENAELWVHSFAGPRLLVARNVSGAFDWLPDGRTLVFMAPIGGDGEKLQSIHRLAVVQENGELMRPAYEEGKDGSSVRMTGADRLAEPEALATALVLNRPALQALPDGRVLFSSQPAALPASGSGPDLEPKLYLVSADGKRIDTVPTKPGDLPANLGYFVASPDGRQLAIVESETDAVAVVEIATGKTRIISEPHPLWQCRTLPAWKSASELTFAALHGTPAQPRWMLWTEASGVRCLNESWPATATAKWLEKKEERK